MKSPAVKEVKRETARENVQPATSSPQAAPATTQDDAAPAPVKSARAREAKGVVKNHVIAAMATSLVPVPLVDLFALSGVQLKMLHSLAKLYHVPFSRQMGKKLITSLLGGLLPTSVAMNVASFAKAIPGLGTATGVASVSVLGGAATYAIGNVFIQHFESGGTLLDFDPRAMREHFAEELRAGKSEATKLK